MGVNNYWPISILPVFSKVYEQNMFNRLSENLKMQNILRSNQFGFREKHPSYTIWIDWHMIFELEQEGECLIAPMELAHPLHPIDNR